jgi:hypothetical protein
MRVVCVCARVACGLCACVCVRAHVRVCVCVSVPVRRRCGGCRPVVFTGAVDCLKKTLAAEGVKGLYRGLLVNFVKTIPAVSTTYLSECCPPPSRSTALCCVSVTVCVTVAFLPYAYPAFPGHTSIRGLEAVAPGVCIE